MRTFAGGVPSTTSSRFIALRGLAFIAVAFKSTLSTTTYP
jgi:hypothetical protein